MWARATASTPWIRACFLRAECDLRTNITQKPTTRILRAYYPGQFRPVEPGLNSVRHHFEVWRRRPSCSVPLRPGRLHDPHSSSSADDHRWSKSSITPPLLSRVLITFTITADTLRIPQLHHQTIHSTFDYKTQLNAPPRRDAEVADADGRPASFPRWALIGGGADADWPRRRYGLDRRPAGVGGGGGGGREGALLLGGRCKPNPRKLWGLNKALNDWAWVMWRCRNDCLDDFNEWLTAVGRQLLSTYAPNHARILSMKLFMRITITRRGSRISARGGRPGNDDLIWDGNERFLTYANTDLQLFMMFIAILCLNGVEQPFKRHQCPFFLPLRRGNPRPRRGSFRPKGGPPPGSAPVIWWRGKDEKADPWGPYEKWYPTVELNLLWGPERLKRQHTRAFGVRIHPRIRDVIFRKIKNRNQTDTNEMATTETIYQTDSHTAEKYQYLSKC